MGGLVARAAIHPQIGDVADKVLGIVHGVMPALGAGAAYRRMRCGVEAPWYGVGAKVAAGVLGDNGADVTAVLAGAQGALELLPSRLYGTHWLEFRKRDKVIKSWPEKCPYEEICKANGKWYGLFREAWINPAGLENSGISNTFDILDKSRIFHEKISETYHECSYAHYGTDVDRKAWYKVIWKAEKSASFQDVELLKVVKDDQQGELSVVGTTPNVKNPESFQFDVVMQDASDPGDQTVPAYSGDAQLRSGKFKGVFRQTGYEHQASYDSDAVIDATLYSLFRIISTMDWSKS